MRSLVRSPSTLILLALLLAFGLVASGRIGNSDVSITLDLSRALLRGTIVLNPECQPCVRGIDGIRTSQYGLGHSLYLIPYVWAGRLAAAVVPRLPTAMWEEFFASFANGPVIALLLLYLARAWRRGGASEGRIAAGLLLFACATPLGPYAKLPFSDALLALGCFAAWYHWSNPPGRAHRLSAGLWLAFALLSRRQADAIVPVLLGLWLLETWQTRQWTAFARLLLGLAPAVPLRLGYNYARFGSPWLEYQPGLTSTKVIHAALQHSSRWQDVLFSESEGLLYYQFVPLAIAALGGWALLRRSPRTALTIAVVVAAGIGFISQLSFSAGVCFGPRYLLYLIPFLGLAWPGVSLPKAWPARVAFSLPVLASVALMAGGFALDPVPVSLRVPLLPGRFAQFRAQAGEWRRILTPHPGPDLPALEASAEWQHDAFRRPDFWWCHLLARGLSAPPTTGPTPPPPR